MLIQSPLMSIALSLISLTTLACAESPQPAVGVHPAAGPEESGKLVSLTKPALYFQGRDGLGKKCHVAVAYASFDYDGEIHQDWLVQVDYVAPDGHRPRLGFARWFAWDDVNGRYEPLSGSGGNVGQGVLVSMSQSEAEAFDESDPNSLEELMQKGHLKEFARLEFSKSAGDLETYKDLVKGVLIRGAVESSEKADLDQLKSLVMVLAHTGHYHTPTCTGYKLEGLREVEFQFEGHDDHDHGHEGKPKH